MARKVIASSYCLRKTTTDNNYTLSLSLCFPLSPSLCMFPCNPLSGLSHFFHPLPQPRYLRTIYQHICPVKSIEAYIYISYTNK